MEIIVLAALILLPILVISDPAPGALRTQAQSRDLDCEWLDSTTGSLRYPGVIRPEPPRGDYIEHQTLRCQQHLMRNGLRSDQDEAILRGLHEHVSTFAGLAVQNRPDLSAQHWHVEVYYPSPQVSTKIAAATKNALMDMGVAVSDRTPTLSVDDIDIIVRMPPTQAYPTACRRYSQNGSLNTDDALLAVVLRDQRETNLHAGICANGQWTWLQ